MRAALRLFLRTIAVIAIVLLVHLLGACVAEPIKISALPDVAAIHGQNETTKKHIATFSESNTKTSVHVQKVKEEHAAESDKLQSVKKDLEELLRE